MTVDFESLSDVLKHPIRRKVILALSKSNGMSYVDLMNAAEVANTGKFNYHLKILADLIRKDDNGKYSLSDKGQLAVQFLQKFGEKKVEQTPLRMADALLIGFAGCILTAANPGFWISFVVAALQIQVAQPLLAAIGLLVSAFGIIVPGALMWLLAVRRAHSHDGYDLFRPPFVAFILLLLLMIAMLLLRIDVVVTIQTPLADAFSDSYGGTVTSYSMMQNSLLRLLLFGLIFSFVGVMIAELASRVRKKMAF